MSTLKYLFYYAICVKLTIIITVITIFNATPTHAQTAPVNAGFVNGIWYSQNQFFAGDNIRVYTAFQNNSGFDLIGKIQFYDGDKLISETNFESISGQLIQKWADWKVEAGNHNIKVKIIDAKKSLPGQTPEPIELPLGTQTVTDTKEIDIDTDGDKIGDTIDLDDDNDSVSDTEEIKQGTDPLMTDGPKLTEIKKEEAVENITQKITDIFQSTTKTDEPKINQPTESFIPASITDKISFATGPINTGVIGQAVAVLEEKRDSANQIIKSGQTTKPIFWNSLNKLSEKYPKIEGVAKALPSSAQIQYSALAFFAFILKTPLVLVIAGLALIIFLWKLTKIFA